MWWLCLVGSLMEWDDSGISRDGKCPVPSGAGCKEAVSMCFLVLLAMNSRMPKVLYGSLF